MSTVLRRTLLDQASDGIVLMIDALDECEVDRPQLLNFIVEMTSLSKAKWIVSNRNWAAIEDRLRPSKRKTTLHLDLNDASISTAVRFYIDHKVATLAQLKGYDTETRKTVQREFMKKASNTFLWVALACRSLKLQDHLHKNPIWSVAFSPDSQWIVSGSHDKTIKIWNIESGVRMQDVQMLRVSRLEVTTGHYNGAQSDSSEIVMSSVWLPFFQVQMRHALRKQLSWCNKLQKTS